MRGRCPAGPRGSRRRATSPGRDRACRCSACRRRRRPVRSSRSPTSPASAAALGAYLRARRGRADWCLLLVGASGLGAHREGGAGRGRRDARRARRRRSCPAFADAWYRARLRAPYLRNALIGRRLRRRDARDRRPTGRALPGLLARLELAIGSALADRDERVHVFTHLSHVYPSGSSLYVTYLFRLGPDPDETRTAGAGHQAGAPRTRSSPRAATISHHHGVGADHAPYLAAEKGALGMAALDGGRADVRSGRDHEPGVLLLAGDRADRHDRRPRPRARRRHPERAGDGVRPGRHARGDRPGPDRAVRPGPARLLRAGRRTSTGGRWARRASGCSRARASGATSLAGVALTTQRGTVVVTDEDGEPLRRAMVWLDRCRAEGLPPDRRQVGPRVQGGARLGHRGDVPRGGRGERARPRRAGDCGRASARFLLLSGFLTHRLTGEFVDSVAAQVGYRPVRLQAPALGEGGRLALARAPRPARAGCHGSSRPASRSAPSRAAAEATGIPAGLPLIAAAGDKACEVLGSGRPRAVRRRDLAGHDGDRSTRPTAGTSRSSRSCRRTRRRSPAPTASRSRSTAATG